jgi:carboxyl-terminal processing protease
MSGSLEGIGAVLREDDHLISVVEVVPGETYDGPVVVMVDRFSASASEILAGALQDYKRALIVGTGPTHGKGTVQVLADLDRVTGSSDGSLGVLKLTIQQFFRVSGASTQWKGVVPEVTLPDPAGHLETGERHLDNSLPYSEIEALPHTDWKPTWNPADLAARSAARVKKDDALAKIAARTEYLKARQADTTLPLARKAWLAQRDERRAALEANTPELDSGPARFAVNLLDGGVAVAARPGGKTDDRIAHWRDNLGRDPWIEETLFVLDDMTAPGAALTNAK